MRRSAPYHCAALLMACGASAGVGASATLPAVTIEDTQVFPESLGAAADGALYIGSWKGIVYRALPGQTQATPWIRPSAENGLLSILGVLVDDRQHRVWVCSVPAATRDPPAPGISSLMAFDLKTGTQQLSLPLPAPASACNDITLANDGAAYISDTPNGRIFRVARGSKQLELFTQNDRLKGIDGIVFSGDGTLYANSVTTNRLWRIAIDPDGSAGAITDITPSEPLEGPDGFRLIGGNRFLLEENAAGRVDEVDIAGDQATIKVLKDGLLSPTAAVRVHRTVYAIERKIDYVRKPELKGQDPGPFTVLALPLPE